MTDTNAGAARRPLAVYAIIDRKDRTTFWMRVGSAFTNRDGSITFYLDAVPTGTNRLQIREARAPDDARPANGAPTAAADTATAELEALP